MRKHSYSLIEHCFGGILETGVSLICHKFPVRLEFQNQEERLSPPAMGASIGIPGLVTTESTILTSDQ